MLFLNTNSGQSINSIAPLPINTQPLANTTDLNLTGDGDLALTPSGDLRITGTSDLIIANLFRRLTTPQGGYERYFFNEAGEYVEYDLGWSDPVINQVSAPLNADLVSWAARKLEEITSIDPRITLIGVDRAMNGQQVALKIYYSLQDNVTLSSTIPLPG